MERAQAIDTGTDELLVSIEDESGVAVVRLNRPGRLNGLTVALMRHLGLQLERLERDDRVRCLLLTGAGRAFSAGADIAAFDASGSGAPEKKPEVKKKRGELASLRLQLEVQRGVVGRIYRMPKPVVASLPGPAAGAALAIALACDLRIASENVVLSTAFARIALSGDNNIAFLLTRLLGSGKASELLFLAPKIRAKEALELGLINRVVAESALEDAALALARELGAGPTNVIGLMKENLNRAIGGDFDECLEGEVAATMICLRSDEHREGVRAFMEKRAARF